MPCQCHKIGGPWIAEDPNCPQHGTEAVRKRIQDEAQEASTEERLQALEQQLKEAQKSIADLSAEVAYLNEVCGRPTC